MNKSEIQEKLNKIEKEILDGHIKFGIEINNNDKALLFLLDKIRKELLDD